MRIFTSVRLFVSSNTDITKKILQTLPEAPKKIGPPGKQRNFYQTLVKRLTGRKAEETFPDPTKKVGPKENLLDANNNVGPEAKEMRLRLA
jgi:hypothetical protein